MKISATIKMKAKVSPDIISLIKIIFRQPVNLEIELKDAEIHFLKNKCWLPQTSFNSDICMACGKHRNEH